jgi:hypothetical protein
MSNPSLPKSLARCGQAGRRQRQGRRRRNNKSKDGGTAATIALRTTNRPSLQRASGGAHRHMERNREDIGKEWQSDR